MAHALLVEDDPDSLRSLTLWVEREGFRVTPAESLAKAREQLAAHSFDLVLVDLELPDGSGLEILEELDHGEDVEVVLVTGHASVETAVGALRAGASDYLTKPIDLAHLRKILGNVVRTLRLRDEIQVLRSELRTLGRFGPMIGASPEMQRVYDLCMRVAPTDATVLVIGETGTGKELVAQTIHRLSRRSNRVFMPINCGAIPPSLIESELFGHERGSFTGADRRRTGIFEHADGGTLFLDEITEMPLELQVKLLRVLETGRISRVGSSEERRVDVRIIAATNRNVDEAAEVGSLRRDLLYRLMVFPIELPLLRDRTGDIELLSHHFVESLNRTHQTSKRLAPDSIERLERYHWPGNVRELKHTIERAFIMSGDVVEPECPGGAAAAEAGTSAAVAGGRGAARPEDAEWLRVRVGARIRDVERELIVATLERDKDKRAAASQLGISLKTLYNRLHEYGMM